MKLLEELRIIEMSRHPIVKAGLPDQTLFYSINPRSEYRGDLSLRALLDVIRSARIDLVILKPEASAPHSADALFRMIFNRRTFTERPAWHRPFAPLLLRWFRAVPVAVVDTSDFAYVERAQFPYLDRSVAFFKRELPQDEWKLFTKTGSRTQPSLRFRALPRYRRRVGKFLPISLGLPADAAASLPNGTTEKTTDIFFAGNVTGLPVRERAVAELRALREDGYNIDIAEGRLDRATFYRRCAQAWLTLSPEGLGWDCFRHYEAAACGSIPLMNQPGIRPYAPFRHGLEGFYYGTEPGGLAAAARAALADRPALRRIAAAAREHVLQHHTPEARARYIVGETLNRIRNAEPLQAG